MTAAVFQPSLLYARSPRPAFHCAPSPLNRKKFGARTLRVVSCAPAEPSTKVFVGCAFAYCAIATDSSPDSGPIITSALFCSTMRRVSLIARSAWSLPQPTATILIGWPAMTPPVMPLRGSFGSFGLAPAYCDRAAYTPAWFCASNEPNAPLHSDITPMRIVVALLADDEALATLVTAATVS